MRSKDWLQRHKKDVYVKKAKKEDYLTRSAFKLIEIEKKFKIISNSNQILELGSSPGGWSQVICNINKKASIIHVDIEPSSLGRYFPITIGICTDSKIFAKQLYDGLSKIKNGSACKPVPGYNIKIIKIRRGEKYTLGKEGEIPINFDIKLVPYCS